MADKWNPAKSVTWVTRACNKVLKIFSSDETLCEDVEIIRKSLEEVLHCTVTSRMLTSRSVAVVTILDIRF